MVNIVFVIDQISLYFVSCFLVLYFFSIYPWLKIQLLGLVTLVLSCFLLNKTFLNYEKKYICIIFFEKSKRRTNESLELGQRTYLSNINELSFFFFFFLNCLDHRARMFTSVNESKCETHSSISFFLFSFSLFFPFLFRHSNKRSTRVACIKGIIKINEL